MCYKLTFARFHWLKKYVHNDYCTQPMLDSKEASDLKTQNALLKFLGFSSSLSQFFPLCYENIYIYTVWMCKIHVQRYLYMYNIYTIIMPPLVRSIIYNKSNALPSVALTLWADISKSSSSNVRDNKISKIITKCPGSFRTLKFCRFYCYAVCTCFKL